MKDREVLAFNIKKARLSALMSQASLAEKSDLSPSYISRVENARENISLDNMSKLAKALDLQTWQLLMSDKEEQNRESPKGGSPRIRRSRKG